MLHLLARLEVVAACGLTVTKRQSGRLADCKVSKQANAESSAVDRPVWYTFFVPIAKGSFPDPIECYLCGEPFSEANRSNTSHVIARSWFGTPPPPDLPTLPAHVACNSALAPREERIRNGIVRMFSNDPAQHLEVLGKAVRSRQPPPREIDRGYRKLAGGILVPAKVIELPDPEDIDQVFRGVTHGLFFKLEGRLLPQAVPIESAFLQECHANPATERLFQLTPGCFTFGNEFAFKVLMKGDDRSNGFWLYLLFNAGVVASFTGEAAQLQFPPARYAFAPTHLST